MASDRDNQPRQGPNRTLVAAPPADAARRRLAHACAAIPSPWPAWPSCSAGWCSASWRRSCRSKTRSSTLHRAASPGAQRRVIRSAPTTSAATWSAGSSGLPGSPCRPGSSSSSSPAPSAASSAPSPGTSAGSSTACIMRTCDAILSFPSIILAMAITAARGEPGLGNAMIAVGIVLWPEYARLMRGQVLSITNQRVRHGRRVDRRVALARPLPAHPARAPTPRSSSRRRSTSAPRSCSPPVSASSASAPCRPRPNGAR